MLLLENTAGGVLGTQNDLNQTPTTCSHTYRVLPPGPVPCQLPAHRIGCFPAPSPPNTEPNSQVRAAKFSFTGQIRLQRPGHGHMGCVQKAPQAPALCLRNGAGLVQGRRRRRLFSDGSICCKRSDCWKCCYYSTHGFSPPLPHCFPSCVLVPGGSPPHCSLVHRTPLPAETPQMGSSQVLLGNRDQIWFVKSYRVMEECSGFGMFGHELRPEKTPGCPLHRVKRAVAWESTRGKFPCYPKSRPHAGSRWKNARNNRYSQVFAQNQIKQKAKQAI